MISNVSYSLNSFEMYPNVFMHHEKYSYTRSSKNFNIKLSYHYINKNKTIITCQGGCSSKLGPYIHFNSYTICCTFPS